VMSARKHLPTSEERLEAELRRVPPEAGQFATRDCAGIPMDTKFRALFTELGEGRL
jgi:hypothetical protein